MNSVHSRLCFLVVLLVALFFAHGAHSQRIVPQEPELEGTSTRKETDQTQQRNLIYPKEDLPGVFGRTSSKTAGPTEEARMQKLKADSAVMRVEFEERLHELRADSANMRNRIQRLSREIQNLQRRMSRLEQGAEGTRTRSLRSPESESMEIQGESDFQAAPSSQDVSADVQFNPNSASIKDLSSIPGLDERLARRIEWYRREVRPFTRRDDLMRVPGIDRGVYGKIAPYFHPGPYS